VKIIIELDGPVLDIGPAYYQVFQQVAAAVGWSRIDQATYWRLTRTKGRDANVLPGAKPGKLKEYQARFAETVESDESIERLLPQPNVGAVLKALTGFSTCVAIALGSNVAARRKVLDRTGLRQHFASIESSSADPRRRSAELRVLAGGDPRTILAAGTDTMIRPAAEAGVLAVGIASGCCTPARLHQAGADVVYRDLSELAEAMAGGGKDLVRAGLLPPALGG